MKSDIPDGAEFRSEDGSVVVHHLAIGWRLWRWVTWWRAKDRSIHYVWDDGTPLPIRVLGKRPVRPLDHTDPSDGAAAWLRKMRAAASMAELDAMTSEDWRAYHEAEFWRLIWPRIRRTRLGALGAYLRGEP